MILIIRKNEVLTEESFEIIKKFLYFYKGGITICVNSPFVEKGFYIVKNVKKNSFNPEKLYNNFINIYDKNDEYIFYGDKRLFIDKVAQICPNIIGGEKLIARNGVVFGSLLFYESVSENFRKTKFALSYGFKKILSEKGLLNDIVLSCKKDIGEWHSNKNMKEEIYSSFVNRFDTCVIRPENKNQNLILIGNFFTISNLEISNKEILDVNFKTLQEDFKKESVEFIKDQSSTKVTVVDNKKEMVQVKETYIFNENPIEKGFTNKLKILKKKKVSIEKKSMTAQETKKNSENSIGVKRLAMVTGTTNSVVSINPVAVKASLIQKDNLKDFIISCNQDINLGGFMYYRNISYEINNIKQAEKVNQTSFYINKIGVSNKLTINNREITYNQLINFFNISVEAGKINFYKDLILLFSHLYISNKFSKNRWRALNRDLEKGAFSSKEILKISLLKSVWNHKIHPNPTEDDYVVSVAALSRFLKLTASSVRSSAKNVLDIEEPKSFKERNELKIGDRVIGGLVYKIGKTKELYEEFEKTNSNLNIIPENEIGVMITHETSVDIKPSSFSIVNINSCIKEK